MKTQSAVLFTMLLIFCLATMLQAQAQGQINYQGKLNKPPTPLNLTFKIYDAATGGQLIWSETKNDDGK
jgi:hypothetical protein